MSEKLESYLPRCPMCHNNQFKKQLLSKQVIQFSCLKCGAKYKLSEDRGSHYITALNLGEDPRGLGLNLKDVENKLEPKFWQGVDAYDSCSTYLR